MIPIAKVSPSLNAGWFSKKVVFGTELIVIISILLFWAVDTLMANSSIIIKIKLDFLQWILLSFELDIQNKIYYNVLKVSF